MSKLKVGMPPESVIYTGGNNSLNTKIKTVSFNKADIAELDFYPKTIDEKLEYWIQIEGLSSVNQIKKIGEEFNIHSLTQEDIVNTGHKPKIEINDEYIFIIMDYTELFENQLKKNNISFYLSKNILISFWDDEKAVFKKIKSRLNTKESLVRNKGVDFLLSRLLDRIIDEYYMAVDSYNDIIDGMEDEVVSNTSGFDHKAIHSLKKEVRKLRRSAVSGKEILFTLLSDPNDIIKEENHKYLRDTFDHSNQIIESCDIQIEQLNSIKNTYDSEINTSLNQTMKVLTLISSIFIPTTFIAGVLGMNFEYIPGTKNEYGFFYTIGVMALITCLFLVYFKRKKWF